ALSGIYAGDPEKLSLSATFPAARRFEEQYGSLIRGALKSRSNRRTDAKQSEGAPRKRTPVARLCNLRDGMATLPDALAAKLGDTARNRTEVQEIRRLQDGFKVVVSRDGATQLLTASAVVFATPTLQAARLLEALEPRFGETLSRIEYASLAQV